MSASLVTRSIVARLRSAETPRSVRVSAFVLALHVVSLSPVPLFGFALVQRITGFLLLTLVPGYVVVDAVRDELRPTDVLYAVGLSVSTSMFVGWALNFLYVNGPLSVEPFTQPNTSAFYVGAFAALTGVVWHLGDGASHQSLRARLRAYDVRALIALATAPVLAVSGATLINRTGFNGVALLTISLVALVPLAVYRFDDAGDYYPFAVAAISLSLLLQNTVVTTHLGAGDGVAEYDIAMDVLQRGYWIPGAAKDAMPRIGVLHPAYALLTDVSLLWEFKLVHPVLFALVPVITYKLATRYFSRDVAFLSAVLYIFLPRTYQLLGRNTRTSSAILFAAFLFLVLLDDDVAQPYRSFGALVFFWSIVVSHYGIGPLVLFAIFVAYALNVGASLLFRGKTASELPLERVTLYGVVTTVWYAYFTDGTFEFIVSAMFVQISRSLFFTSQSTATRSLSFEMPSGSYQVMYYGHIALAVLTALGVGLVYLRYVAHGTSRADRLAESLRRRVFPGLSEPTLRDSTYLHLAIGLFLFFPLSFGPQILSAGRTFGLVMVLLAPFPVCLLRSSRGGRVGSKPALTALTAFLLVTSGFVSAVATHDVSPQPTIDGERIVESGTTVAQFSYYRVVNPESSIAASKFVVASLPDGARVYKTALGTFFPDFYRGDSGARIRILRLDPDDPPSTGYIYLSEADTVTDTNTQQHVGFVYYAYEPLRSYDNRSVIYTTGADRVYYTDD